VVSPGQSFAPLSRIWRVTHLAIQQPGGLNREVYNEETPPEDEDRTGLLRISDNRVPWEGGGGGVTRAELNLQRYRHGPRSQREWV
jgi:hypothetical protein